MGIIWHRITMTELLLTHNLLHLYQKISIQNPHWFGFFQPFQVLYVYILGHYIFL